MMWPSRNRRTASWIASSSGRTRGSAPAIRINLYPGPHEFLVPADAPEQPVDIERIGLRGRVGGAGRARWNRNAFDGLDEIGGPDRLGQVAVHTGGETPFAVAAHRVRGEGNDRHVGASQALALP